MFQVAALQESSNEIFIGISKYLHMAYEINFPWMARAIFVIAWLSMQFGKFYYHQLQNAIMWVRQLSIKNFYSFLIIFYRPVHMNGRFHSMFFYLNGLLIWIFFLVFNSMFYIGYVTPFAMDIVNTTFSLFCPVQNSRPPLPLIQGRQSRLETH